MKESSKVEVSRQEFAGVLSYWLAKQVNMEAIQQLAKTFDLKGKPKELFGINLKNKKEFYKLAEELFALNMWMIVYSCEIVLEDTKKRNDCLDGFHLIAYQRIIGGIEENFNEWKLYITAKYIKYNEAMGADREANPLWRLANTVNTSLFGKLKLDVHINFQIAGYVSSTIQALRGMIDKYDIK